ncbi:MAG: PAS domain-containing sensor histidine kinase [Acetobacteraceae bacterium]|nr:PAS domain-containing sensor histidine kinase [Acetobacteraceae bacterium]
MAAAPTRRIERALWRQAVARLLLSNATTLFLAAAALALGATAFAIFNGEVPSPGAVFGLVLATVVVLLPLLALMAARVTGVWFERRRGVAGAKLHVRLVLLFGGVAVAPAIVVAIFASVFFNMVVQNWFNDNVRTALTESLQVARGYADEHRNKIRADAIEMGNDLDRARLLYANDPDQFDFVLAEQTALRGLTEATIFEPLTGHVTAHYPDTIVPSLPPDAIVARGVAGEIPVFGNADGTQVRALVNLDFGAIRLLSIGRPVDTGILEHINRTEQVVAEYQRQDANSTGLQVTFALIFTLIALVVLAAAVLTGLLLANQIARPIGRLIAAVERVRAGDLSVRVPERDTGDEISWLGRAFNRMTGQLAAQRGELMDAYSQIDTRRRFIEAVLSGVSAGVIGLDQNGRIELPNRIAGLLLEIDLLSAIGRDLADVVPEFAPLLARALAAPGQAHTAEIAIGPPSHRRVLLLRIGADHHGLAMAEDDVPRGFHFVATFDDITELQSAQRKAAWSDVARRIAHEIKNPLTPIQLSAERLKRRFAREITSDPETFIQCADTIVRHVGDIGRMVDEFSSFARMPQPVIRPEPIGRVLRDALVLQQTGHPEIGWDVILPDPEIIAPCDRRLLGQALTNLLQNAADAVAMVSDARIGVKLARDGGRVCITVSDNGAGLPGDDRDRLTEPYVTHKTKGTGLGLAIVKKIMEDHAGSLLLEDRVADANWPGTGASVSLCWPVSGVGS